MYSSYRDVTPESFAEVLLRTGKLAEAKTEGQTPFPATEGENRRHSPRVCEKERVFGFQRWDP